MNIAFNTANLVARVSDYRFSLNQWSQQHQRTMRATDAAAWYAICQEIADTGFTAIEVWEAHAAPESMSEANASLWLQIMEDHGLEPVGYFGTFRPETVEVCRWLDIPMINGRTHLDSIDATHLCKRSGVRFNLQNFSQTNAFALIEEIDGGNEWLGLSIDTGWLATHGARGPMVIRDCGDLVRHVHCKDIEAADAHVTCRLGTGVADLDDCIQALKDLEYDGWYSWVDLPEERNPLDTAMENRHWLEQQVRQ